MLNEPEDTGIRYGGQLWSWPPIAASHPQSVPTKRQLAGLAWYQHVPYPGIRHALAFYLNGVQGNKAR